MVHIRIRTDTDDVAYQLRSVMRYKGHIPEFRICEIARTPAISLVELPGLILDGIA